MEQFEKVEKLREKANISYEEAKAVLEACNWDMLDAIVYLEKQGKMNGPKDTSYTTHYQEPEHFDKNASQYNEEKSSFKDSLRKFFKWCGKIIKKGNTHYFDITRKGENILSIPITLFIIIILLAFWAVIVLLIVGLFFGFRYHFRGPELKADSINHAMDKASETAENIKNDIKDGFNN